MGFKTFSFNSKPISEGSRLSLGEALRPMGEDFAALGDLGEIWGFGFSFLRGVGRLGRSFGGF